MSAMIQQKSSRLGLEPEAGEAGVVSIMVRDVRGWFMQYTVHWADCQVVPFMLKQAEFERVPCWCPFNYHDVTDPGARTAGIDYHSETLVCSVLHIL